MKKREPRISLPRRILALTLASTLWAAMIQLPVQAQATEVTNNPSQSEALGSDTSGADSSTQQSSVPEFTVRFLDYSDTLVGEAQTIAQGEAAVPPAEAPAPEGQVFSGWESDAYLNVQADLDIRATYMDQVEGTFMGIAPAAKKINVWATALTVSDTSKEYGTPDPRPVLLGMPAGLVDGVDYYVEYQRTPAESISSTGYHVTVKTFYFINSNYDLQGDPSSIKEGRLIITTRNISITANSASKVYDGLPLTNSGYTVGLTGLASGHTATVSISGSRTVVGSSANTVGAVTIRDASNADVTSWYVITKINGTLTVTPAPLLIKADNKIVNYGDPIPTYTLTYTGFVNGETTAVLTSPAVTSCSYIVGSAPGTYPISVSGAAAANYSISYQPASLTVLPNTSQITVTAGSGSKTYDGTPLTKNTYVQTGLPAGFTMSVTISGSVTNVADNTANNNIVTGVTIYNAANQDVTAYFPNIILAPGTLTIIPAPLTAEAADISINYLDPVPTYTVSYSGFVNGENESVITTPATLTCGYAQGDAPQMFLINASNVVAPNYTVNYLPGVLTVAPNTTLITVTAASATKTYDGNALTNNNYITTGLPVGYNLSATVSGSVTNVADTVSGNNQLSDVVLLNGASEDVTAYFSNIVLVNGTLSIQPAPLTVVADNYIVNFNDPVPSYTASYSGFVNGETEAVLTTPVTLTGSYVQGDAPGGYGIIPSGGVAANYLITYLPGLLTVQTNSRQIIVTADSNSKTYDGTPLTDDDYTVLGLPIGFTLEATVTGSVTNVADSAVGNNVVSNIIIRNLLNQDVTAFFPNILAVNGSLTITPAALTAEMTDYVIIFDDPAPTYGVTYTGFVNGETETVLTNPTTAACSYVQGDPVGQYPITGSGATAANYSISYLAGTLTVAPDSDQITVLASYASKTYDGTPLTSSNYTVIGLPAGYSAQVTISGSATHVVDSIPGNNVVGTVTIYDDAMVDVTGNFSNIVKIDGTLTITPATITAKMDDQVISYLDPAPTYGTTYTGFVNGETEAVLLTPTTPTCAYAPGDYAGSYDIFGSGASAADYVFSYQQGTLTVQKNDTQLVFTAASDSKIYDGTALTNSTYFTSGILPQDFTAEVTVVGTALHVPDSVPGNNQITSVIIKDGSNIDVTANFSNITAVNGTLTITPKTLIGNVDNESVTFGDAPPVYHITYAGFVPGEDESAISEEGTITCSYVTGAATGSYPISASGGLAQDYTFVYVPGTLTVMPYSQTITVVAAYATKVYDGTALTASGYTVVGTLPTGYTLEAVVTGSATNVADSLIGNNVVTSVIIRNASNEDVTANFSNLNKVNGTLTITPAPLTIEARDLVVSFTDPEPIYTAIYTGFVNGETVAVLTSPVSFSGTYHQGDEPGVYSITDFGAAAANYVITYLPGVVVVTASEDQITVLADSNSKPYDGSPLTDAGYNVVGLPDGYTLQATVSGTVTNVADTTNNNNVITSFTIYDDTMTDVTADFANVVLVPGTLSVTTDPLVAKMQDMEVPYGAPIPAYTVTYSGFVNNETEAVLTAPTVAEGTYTQGSIPGTYTITGKGASASNYTIYYQPGALVVTENHTAIVVTSADATKVYDGMPLTNHNFTQTGLPEGYHLSVEVTGAVTNVDPLIWTDANLAEMEPTTVFHNNTIGKITIYNHANEDVTAYFSNISKSEGALWITPKDVVITANSFSKEVGAKDPTLTAMVTGAVNNETLNYELERVAGETVGEYVINVKAGENPNYTVTTNPGKLTITAKPTPIIKTGETQGITIIIAAAALALGALTTGIILVKRKKDKKENHSTKQLPIL